MKNNKNQNFFLTSQSICGEREREREILYRKEELFKTSSSCNNRGRGYKIEYSRDIR